MGTLAPFQVPVLHPTSPPRCPVTSELLPRAHVVSITICDVELKSPFRFFSRSAFLDSLVQFRYCSPWARGGEPLLYQGTFGYIIYNIIHKPYTIINSKTSLLYLVKPLLNSPNGLIGQDQMILQAFIRSMGQIFPTPILGPHHLAGVQHSTHPTIHCVGTGLLTSSSA